MSRKIIHVVSDEKFIDIALRQFEEVAPGLNLPLTLSPRRELRYVRNKSVEFFSLSEAIEVIQSELCAAVVFHSLHDSFLPLLQRTPGSKKVFWLGWGYDYYDTLLREAYPEGLLLPRTQALAAGGALFSLLSRAKRKAIFTTRQMLGQRVRFTPELIERVDYFCPVLEIEYEMARQINPSLRPQYLSWNYGTIEDDLSNESCEGVQLGEDVLVGNSATPQINHVEIFDLLREQPDIEGRRIIVPLSYGDVQYRDRIISVGRKYFGNRFVPITEFLPRDEYIVLLNSCGFVFMNHLRQQGMGNIIISMMKGAKVFMNPVSPAYQWLMRAGASVHSILELEGSNSQTWTPIGEEEHRRNMALMYSNFGRDVQREKTRRLVEIALSRNSGRA